MTSSSSESVSNRSGPHRSGGSNQQDHSSSNENVYECNICFDSATDPVVSMCGHLFCWPCLHQWLETRPSRKECPVCKSGIDRDKVIPVYSRGGTNQQDPRDKIPPRPQGQRTEPENNNAFPGFGFSEGFQMSFGIGAFPFSMFWANNGGRPQANNMYAMLAYPDSSAKSAAAGHPPNQTLEDQFLSRIFLFAAIIFLLWLLVS